MLSVWGKTDTAPDGRPITTPLVRHLEDCAAVAGYLWDHFLPRSVKTRISSGLPGGDADGRKLYRFLSGVHDIAKCAPSFSVKVLFDRKFGDAGSGVLDDMARVGLDCGDLRIDHKGLPPHCRAGQVILTRWLRDRFDASRWAADRLAGVIGAHHGVPSTNLELRAADHERWIGGDNWQTTQDEILDKMAAVTGATDRLQGWLDAKIFAESQVLLAGAVVIADWLASDQQRFLSIDPRSSEERARTALSDWDLPRPWAASPPPTDADAHFRDRFAGKSARPVQRAAVDAAWAATQAPMIVIEAGTGEGKTEAALMAAEVLAHRFGCGGIMFALPTQATSNGVFPRVRDWVERLPGIGRTSMFLAHGSASLNDEFQGVIDASRIGSIDDEYEGRDAIAVATAWLRGRRKGLLANFVVGTIDQVLLGALRARHLPLRQLALAGKVVIIDEAHAADPYMRTYGRGIMWWLGAFGTPVVLLSATLPPAIRAEWMQAYVEGSSPDRDNDGDPASTMTLGINTADLSPRITMVDDQVREIPVAQGGHATRRLKVQLAGFSADAADDQVINAVRDGGIVAVVANTVDRAQAAYNRFVRALGADRVELFHSRFLANHRSAREDRLRQRLGPPGPSVSRPHGLVVVATQVIEQSLDVDFDLMVSDLAPIDLLIQRAGRLHRHVRGEGECDRPAYVRTPRLLLIGAETRFDDAPFIEGGVGAVYHDRDLLDALDVLAPHLAGRPLTTPTDVPGLVRAAYDRGRPMPTEWADAVAEFTTKMGRAIAEQHARAETFLVHWPATVGNLQNYFDGGRGADSEEQGAAQVRDGDESLEVIVVRRNGHTVRAMPGCGLDDVVLPTEYGAPDDRVARVLASCRLRLPRLGWGANQYIAIDEAIRQLEKRNRDLTGWQLSYWLKGALVLDVDDNLRTELVGRRYHYDLNRGLVREPKE